jgi:hypothetical protein
VVCDQEPCSASLKKGILSAAKAETGHAAYLREALKCRLTVTNADRVLDGWCTRKVNDILAMVRFFLQRSGKMPSLVQDGVPVEQVE